MIVVNLAFLTRLLAAAVVIGSFSIGAALAGGSHDHGHAPAFGTPGDAAKADRTVEVILTDNRFSIPTLTVKEGETVRFVIHNKGSLAHEFNIGTATMHAEHQKEMLKMFEQGMMAATSINHDMMHGEDSQMKHDDPNSVLLEPGKSGELTWIFKQAEALEFACNVPGHYQSGMVGKIKVTTD
jgi:uncharacterized cupredoxin-like copper-binding protein